MDKKQKSPSDTSLKEMDDLKKKIKNRGTKLQAKFVKFREKIEDNNVTAPITNNTNKNANIQQKPRTQSANLDAEEGTSSGNGGQKMNKSAANNNIEIAHENSGNGNHIHSQINRVRGKLLKYTSQAPVFNFNSNNQNNGARQWYPEVLNNTRIDFLARNRCYSERSAHLSTNTNNTFVGDYASQRSNSLTVPGHLDEYGHESASSSNYNQNSRNRKRGKRGMNTKPNQLDPNHVPIYARETEHLNINAETLLILDLLALPLQDHTDFLINLAKTRKILLLEKDDYVLNPSILRLTSILMLGDQCRKFNPAEQKRLEMMANASTLRQQKSQENRKSSLARQEHHQQQQQQQQQTTKRCIDDRRKIFEDFVNALVHDELPEEKKKEFLFPALSKRQRVRNYFCLPEFEENLEIYAQKCVAAKFGKIIEGELRVNAKNNDQSFVRIVENQRDAFLCSSLVRKFALHGDIVRVFVRNNCDITKSQPLIDIEKNIAIAVNSESPSDTLDTTIEDEEEFPIVGEKNARAFVIKIIKKVHNRKCVGTFLSYRKDSDYITFVPRDMKMPNLKIFKEDWPENLQKGNLENIGDILYTAEITDWINDVCVGKILYEVGKCGVLESENKAILLQNNLSMEPYDEKFNEMHREPLVITAEDIKNREDCRTDCIFTIDPLTARDLDDAMSCKELPDGNFEIGVHISDVSHFLDEQSELDDIVKQRTTSVYMVNEVFHMLPKPLCFKCSLLPGEDKFAFSVFWKMTNEGEILETRFARTIVNSCTQLAYEHAQLIIDNPDRKFTEQDFPQIHNGFKVDDIVRKVKRFHSIAEFIRSKRFSNGALKINKPKLYFELNAETGTPAKYNSCILRTANFLIEEFMLLANQSVADFTYKKFPLISILRNHQPPLKNVIQKVKDRLDTFGMTLDITSSKSIYETFNKLVASSNNPEALEICLSHIVSKPMARARYFCSEESSNMEDFWHFALSIPIYTHFTSPIRRYPDVMVHRVLSAALGYNEPPKRTPDELAQITAVCNEKKYTSKLAGEDSVNLYFMHYIKSKENVLMRAAILELFNSSMEVVLIDSGHILRVAYQHSYEKTDANIVVNEKVTPKTALLTFASQPKLPPIELKTFDEVMVEVFVEKSKIKAKIPSKLDSKKKRTTTKPKIEQNPILENDSVDEGIETNSTENSVLKLVAGLKLNDNDDGANKSTKTLLPNIDVENVVEEIITSVTDNSNSDSAIEIKNNVDQAYEANSDITTIEIKNDVDQAFEVTE